MQIFIVSSDIPKARNLSASGVPSSLTSWPHCPKTHYRFALAMSSIPYLQLNHCRLSSVGVICHLHINLCHYRRYMELWWQCACLLCNMRLQARNTNSNMTVFVGSVIPLIGESLGILMQRQPKELDDILPNCFHRVCGAHKNVYN